MRKNIIKVGVTLGVMTMAIAGCTKNPQIGSGDGITKAPESITTAKATEATPDYEAMYKEVLDEYYDFIAGFTYESDAKEHQMGVDEVLRSHVDSNTMLDAIGYLYKDINADEIPELLIMKTETKYAGKWSGTDVLAIYTIHDNKPMYLVTGTARSGYCMMDNNHLYYHGSSGAAYTAFGEFVLEPKATKLTCESFYFTVPKDGSFDELVFYKNKTGDWDEATSEKLDITGSAFMKYGEDINARVCPLEMDHFRNYKR